MGQPDWLDSGSVDAARADMAARRVEFAQNYLVFETDGRAKALLAHWTESMQHRRTPVDATIQRYAADEAVRAFIAGIHEELRVARKGVA